MELTERARDLPRNRYIDCEEAYKQCLWLEGRGYKPKPAPGGGGGAGVAAGAAMGSMYGQSPR